MGEDGQSKVGTIMTNYHMVRMDVSARLSPYCSIVGDVVLGPNVSVFAGSHIRGDGAPIRIGANTNVQENCSFHVSGGFPLTLGNDVTVGHSATLHGCTIDDNVLVGMGSIVMDGAHIQRDSLIAAGSLVTQGKEFPPRSLIMGSPAKVVRELTDEEVESLVSSASPDYQEVAASMLANGLMYNPPLGADIWPAPKLSDSVANGGPFFMGMF